MTNDEINVVLDNAESISSITKEDNINAIINDNMSEISPSLDNEDNITAHTTTSTVNVIFGDGNYNIRPITSYEELDDLPQINEVTLIGNKNSEDLHLQDEMDYLTNLEIEELLDNFV